MKLRYVTLTGADESVPPSDLLNLSARYPFVEWGILFSLKRIGGPRYPSAEWAISLMQLVEKTPPFVNLSAHLCGALVRESLEGDISFFAQQLQGRFQRLQLNFGSAASLDRAFRSQPLMTAIFGMATGVIFGGDFERLSTAPAYLTTSNISPLFDASGGRGVECRKWPVPIAPLTGYAGGIGPENVDKVLCEIEKVAGDSEVWIDMESNLRTDDKFDMYKCEAVLETCKPFVN